MASSDARIATLDREAFEDVARLVLVELTSANVVTPPSRARRIGRLHADRVVQEGKELVVLEVKSASGAARVTERDLSRAIKTAFRKIIGHGDVVVFRDGGFSTGTVMRKLIERLPSIVEARRQTLMERHIEALVDAFLPADALAPVMPDIEADNAKAQADFLKIYSTLTADEVAQRAGHSAANRSATANRWKGDRKIFSLRAGGRDVYPAFQFKEGRPWPSLQSALSALSGRSGWQIALWFITPNSWLGGIMPIERLDDGNALTAAAGHEAEAWLG